MTCFDSGCSVSTSRVGAGRSLTCSRPMQVTFLESRGYETMNLPDAVLLAGNGASAGVELWASMNDSSKHMKRVGRPAGLTANKVLEAFVRGPGLAKTG